MDIPSTSRPKTPNNLAQARWSRQRADRTGEAIASAATAAMIKNHWLNIKAACNDHVMDQGSM